MNKWKHASLIRKQVSSIDPKKGTHGKKDIPGHRFVETRKTPNGDTEHVYEQLMTRHIDKGNW